LTAVAGYILARKLEWITNRDVQRGDRTMRGLKRVDIENVFQQLDALGWVDRVAGRRISDPPRWSVNEDVHRLFAERGAKEAERRERERLLITKALSGSKSEVGE
jgi:ribosomal protein S19E (S16A)